MSLINQMLSDLEQRRGGHAPDGEQILAGVHVAELETRAPAVVRWLLIAVLVGVSAACAAWYGLGLFSAASRPLAAVASAASGPVLKATRVPDARPPAARRAPIPVSEARKALSAVAPRVIETATDENESLANDLPTLSTENELAVDAADLPQSPTVELPAPVATSTPAVDMPASIEFAGTLHKTTSTTAATREEKLAALLARLRHEPGVAGELADFVAANPGLVAARAAYVSHLMRDHDHERAEQAVRDGLAIAPQEARYTWLLAHLLVKRNELPEALATLVRATPASDEAGEYYALAAALNQRLGLHAQAIATYRHALNQSAARGAWWVGLGISLSAEQQPGPAQHAFRRALEDRRLSDNLRQYAHREIGRLNASS